MKYIFDFWFHIYIYEYTLFLLPTAAVIFLKQGQIYSYYTTFCNYNYGKQPIKNVAVWYFSQLGTFIYRFQPI